MSEEQEPPAAKRVKRSIEDDLICPITLELPFDPVTAMDGQVYERHAIEKHIRMHRKQDAELRSPMTNNPMGEQLVAAPRHRSIIEISIENGVITGDLAQKWLSKQNLKKEFDEISEKAEKGDADAMGRLCRVYFHGTNSVIMKDKVKALEWAKLAHRAGCVAGTSRLGTMLAAGQTVNQRVELGLLYVGIAAGKGDPFANYQVGKLFLDGHFDCPVDHIEAKKHFELAAAEGTCDILSREKAREKLRELRSVPVTPDSSTPS